MAEMKMKRSKITLSIKLNHKHLCLTYQAAIKIIMMFHKKITVLSRRQTNKFMAGQQMTLSKFEKKKPQFI